MKTLSSSRSRWFSRSSRSGQRATAADEVDTLSEAERPKAVAAVDSAFSGLLVPVEGTTTAEDGQGTGANRTLWLQEIGKKLPPDSDATLAEASGLGLGGVLDVIRQGLEWCDAYRRHELPVGDDALLNYEQSLLGLLRTFFVDPLKSIVESPYSTARCSLRDQRERAGTNRWGFPCRPPNKTS